MPRYFSAMLDDLVEQGFMECLEDEVGNRYYAAIPITTNDVLIFQEDEPPSQKEPFTLW